jgi:hypothetical protein
VNVSRGPGVPRPTDRGLAGAVSVLAGGYPYSASYSTDTILKRVVTFEVFRDKSGEDKSVAMNARILVLVKGGQQRSVGAIRQSGVGPCGAGNRRPRK